MEDTIVTRYLSKARMRRILGGVKGLQLDMLQVGLGMQNLVSSLPQVDEGIVLLLVISQQTEQVNRLRGVKSCRNPARTLAASLASRQYICARLGAHKGSKVSHVGKSKIERSEWVKLLIRNKCGEAHRVVDGSRVGQERV